MRFKIMAESHEGVISMDEECIATIEAPDELTALQQIAIKDERVHYNDAWDTFLIGDYRKVFAVKE